MGEIGPGQVCSGEVRPGEVRAWELGMGYPGVVELGVDQGSLRDVCVGQVDPGEVGLGETTSSICVRRRSAPASLARVKSVCSLELGVGCGGAEVQSAEEG